MRRMQQHRFLGLHQRCDIAVEATASRGQRDGRLDAEVGIEHIDQSAGQLQRLRLGMGNHKWAALHTERAGLGLNPLPRFVQCLADQRQIRFLGHARLSELCW